MNNHKLVDRIQAHQALAKDGLVHPMTCGNNSDHWVWPTIQEDIVILVCRHCDYKQLTIPKIFKDDKYDNLRKNYSGI